MRTDFPELGAASKDTYLAWLREVCRRTAHTILHWMRVGFVHGVMNTDNMSVLGLTIDYGPYGWLEDYDPSWTPNTTDAEWRRYRFGAQPQVALWNLGKFANALLPLVEDVPALEQALSVYNETFASGWQTMMAGKLGLVQYCPSTDDALVGDLLTLLQSSETDMTIFYRSLCLLDSSAGAAEETLLAPFMAAYYRPETLSAEQRQLTLSWLKRYTERLRQQGLPDRERQQRMQGVNPKYVLRNYLAQLAIDSAEQGDFGRVTELLDLLRNPYAEQPGRETYAGKRPDWARQRPGCSMLSCSS